MVSIDHPQSILLCHNIGVNIGVLLQVNIRSSLYSTFLSDWMKVFPKKQFHVIRSEDYYLNRKSVLENSVTFLGLGV